MKHPDSKQWPFRMPGIIAMIHNRIFNLTLLLMIIKLHNRRMNPYLPFLTLDNEATAQKFPGYPFESYRNSRSIQDLPTFFLGQAIFCKKQ